MFLFFFFKQKTAYGRRISDWSSDVCSSDLKGFPRQFVPSKSLARRKSSWLKPLLQDWGGRVAPKRFVEHQRQPVRRLAHALFGQRAVFVEVGLAELVRAGRVQPARIDQAAGFAGPGFRGAASGLGHRWPRQRLETVGVRRHRGAIGAEAGAAEDVVVPRSEEHTSELQSLMRISYAVFCLKKKTQQQHNGNANRTEARDLH